MVDETSRRIRLFGVDIDAVTMNQAVERVFEWVESDNRICRYVVTPNVDHTVILRENRALRDAYDDASMVLADGHPVVFASRLLGKALPARVPGSDLVPALFEAANADRPLRVFLLGAAPGVAERAAANITRKWSGVEIVATYSPPLGFEKDDAENQHILDRIAEAKADVIIVGLGAPKQETWVHKHHREIRANAVLCVGATIDFLAGEKRRAPQWLQRVGLEWLHRMMSEPKRLIKRYLRDATIFPQLVWQEWKASD